MKPVLMPDDMADAWLRLRHDAYGGQVVFHWDKGQPKEMDVVRPPERIKVRG